MTRKLHIILQVLLLAAQILNGLLPVLEGNAKVYVVAILGFIQGGTAIIAHSYNTDGTPQTVAFQDQK